MVCPNCNAEIEDDLLYCPKCGEEVQFVPYYEPEIEQSISDTLSDIQMDAQASYEEDKALDMENRGMSDFGTKDLEYVDLDAEENTSAGYDERAYMENAQYYGDAPERYDGGNEDRTDGYETGYDGEYEDGIEGYEVGYDRENEDSIEGYGVGYGGENEDSIEGYEVGYGGENEDRTDGYETGYDSEYEIDSYDDEDGIEGYEDEYDGEISDGEEQEEFDEEFDEEYELDYFDEFDEEDPHIMCHFLKFMKESRLRWVVIALLLVVVAFAAVGITRFSQYMYQNNSSSYQAQLAASFAAEGNYADAVRHMERSVLLSSDDTSLKYQLAEYYFHNGEDDKGILMLWEIIGAEDVNYQAAYWSLINYYATRQDYVKIEEILSNCDDMIIVNQFQNYLANEPQFSSPGGTYDEIVYLKLSSNSEGTIYYTTDGTTPTDESPVYREPLVLDLGIYKINAIFVNSYGIESDVASMTYTIDIRVPNPPNVILEGGDYTAPELIVVDVQPYCTVYYTTDKTMPTNESTEYTGPVPMPLGSSHFTFIAYSQEGIPGDVTEVDYNLSLQGTAQVQDITMNLMQYNVNLGKASDLTGYVAGNTMRYSYVVSSAIRLEDKIYYIFVENMISNSPSTEQGTAEQSMRTGTFYLADINDGSLYKGIHSEEAYIRGELIPPEAYAPPMVNVSENMIE